MRFRGERRQNTPGALRLRYGHLTTELERRRQVDAIPAPEAARVVPARRAVSGEEAHVLVGRGHELGAVDRLECGRAAPDAAGEPAAEEARRGGEGAAVEARDHLHHA